MEDDSELRSNLQLLLGRDQLEITAVGTITEAMAELAGSTFDCMVTDLALPDGTGYDLLERMAGNDAVAFPPVIDQGFAVTSASDGVEAVAYLQGKTQYAVVVTDVSMPGGISGLDVAARVAETQPGARVFVVSGLQRSQLPPIPTSVRFLPKPYRFKQLITAIDQM